VSNRNTPRTSRFLPSLLSSITLASLAILSGSQAYAGSANDADAWAAKWRDLCRYDCGGRWGGGCLQVATSESFNSAMQCALKEQFLDKNDKVKWVEPPTVAVQALAAQRDHILAFAKQFGVDPRAIVASALGENSMNHTEKAGDMQRMLHSLAINGKVFGQEPIRFGFGSIYDHAVRPAEEYLAKEENRQPKLDTVDADIHDPIKSLYWTAAVLRYAQDVYKKECGFDIRGNFPILASLYNMGPMDSKTGRPRCKKAQEEGRQPKVNYYGFFVERWEHVINDILGIEPDLPRDLAATRTASGSLKLQNAAPTCYASKQVKATETIESGTNFTPVAAAQDCKQERWTLVQSADGKKGWVKEAVLRASSKESGEKLCIKQITPECQKTLTELASASSREIEQNSQGISLPLYATKVCRQANGTVKSEKLSTHSVFTMKKTEAGACFAQQEKCLPVSGDAVSDMSSVVNALNRGEGASEAKDCEFDRKEGADFIAKLSAQKCVGSIAVPDMLAFDMLRSRDVQVVYQPMKDLNRIEISADGLEACQAENSSEQGKKPKKGKNK
jgi:hypothetical protein